MSFDTALIWGIVTALVAGLTRGFSGFGGGLIFIPLISALFSPRVAAPTLLVVDAVMTLPMVYGALRNCIWREVAPLAIAAVLAVPLGVALLETVDPIVLRWGISALAVVLLALLVFGKGRAAPRSLIARLGIGATSGVLGGAAQLSGPPVVVYWLGTGQSAAMVRANLIAFFSITTLASGIAYLSRGMVTGEVLHLCLVLGPTYAIGLVAGVRGFRYANDRHFRLVAYGVIALSAIASMPLLDPILRP